MCGCPSHIPDWRPGPKTQACALTRNRTSNPLVHRLVLNLLSHTSQDCLFLNLSFIVFFFHCEQVLNE